MKDRANFSVMVIVPATAVICFALGYQVASDHFPMALVERSILALLSFWIAFALMEMIVGIIWDAMTMMWEDDEDRRPQILYIVNEGEVIERLKTRKGFFNGVDDVDTRRAMHKLLGKLGVIKQPQPGSDLG